MDSSTVVEKGIIAPMTTYEKLAIALSVIAILIPIIQWAWKKWITKPILKHMTTGRANLFINTSGSYLQFDGVFEAERKPITVKNIDIKVVKKQNSNTLNLSWSVFRSPVNQQIIGNYATTTELAHPFRIEANSVVCAFIEFTDYYDSAGKTIKPLFDALYKNSAQLHCRGLTYEQAYSDYIEQESYAHAKSELEKQLFWTIGEYFVALIVEYGKKKVRFTYKFDVNESDNGKLHANLEEILLVPLKDRYALPRSIQAVSITVREDKE